MQSVSPIVIDYRHRRRTSHGRFRAAVVLTLVGGVAAGVAISFRIHPGLILLSYPFGCTLVMGLLAGRRQVVISLAACSTISTTLTAVELFRAGRFDPTFVFLKAFPAWIALFFVSGVCAAVALPLTLVRYRARGRTGELGSR